MAATSAILRALLGHNQTQALPTTINPATFGKIQQQPNMGQITGGGHSPSASVPHSRGGMGSDPLMNNDSWLNAGGNLVNGFISDRIEDLLPESNAVRRVRESNNALLNNGVQSLFTPEQIATLQAMKDPLAQQQAMQLLMGANTAANQRALQQQKIKLEELKAQGQLAKNQAQAQKAAQGGGGKKSGGKKASNPTSPSLTPNGAGGGFFLP